MRNNKQHSSHSHHNNGNMDHSKHDHNEMDHSKMNHRALLSRLWTGFFDTARCRYTEKFSKPRFQPKMA